MTNTLVLSSPAASFPVTLEEAKAHLRLESSEEDSLVSILIQAATDWAEVFCNKKFITQTWTIKSDNIADLIIPGPIPSIALPFGPIQSVSQFGYTDEDGAAQTLTENSDFLVYADGVPPRLIPTPGKSWPDTATEEFETVQIEIIAGFGAASAVPAGIKQAILIMLAHYFEHRQEFLVGANLTKIPIAAEWLLWPHRDFRIAQ